MYAKDKGRLSLSLSLDGAVSLTDGRKGPNHDSLCFPYVLSGNAHTDSRWTHHSLDTRQPRLKTQYIFFSPRIADGANQRATLPIPRVVTRDLPISPRFTPTSFYRDAGSTPRQSMNFSYSRPHPFRYGNQKKHSLLLRLGLINSD